MPATNYYTLLTIPRTASTADIKARYRKLSLKYHPDSGGTTEQMVLLNKAYGVLSNPLRRREYDQKLPSLQSHSNVQTRSTGYDFVRTAPPRPTRPAAPIARATADESIWNYARQDEHKKTHKRFLPWLVISIAAVVFLGYQVLTVVRPSSGDMATGVATTATPTVVTTPTTNTNNNATTVSTSSPLAVSITNTPPSTNTTSTSDVAQPTSTKVTTATTSHAAKHHSVKYNY
jgi:hypothetical protein